ncbi:uncharacterized protein EDB91DRAFT_1144920 [Suillus paluster]|uniref:uncharacterized protein n=1 Tax=Suillus paluster TaxID=48578 RepID=UPI001B8831FF|nr:uncharacterized protein EDB91DRAFT_1144920 [Suillus paluster]KAG1735335.1 hypothetical protein EDB91DRAFT_1144920 [Suillus paluster]
MGGDHQCPVCQATFTRPQHVARHMRSHTGDRPYKCQYCGDQFARSDLLSRHVNKCHANEKPPPSATNGRRKGSASASRATTSKQACDQCVQSSLPCDGSNPCSKCVQRKSRCTYVKFHRQTAPSGPGHHNPRPTSASSSLGNARLPLDDFILGPPPMSVPSMDTSSGDPLYTTPFSFNHVYASSANPVHLPMPLSSDADIAGRNRAQVELLRQTGASILANPQGPPGLVPELYSDPNHSSTHWLGWGENPGLTAPQTSPPQFASLDEAFSHNQYGADGLDNFSSEMFTGSFIGSAYRPRRGSIDYSDGSSASQSIPSSATSSNAHLPLSAGDMYQGASEDFQQRMLLDPQRRRDSMSSSSAPEFHGQQTDQHSRVGEGGFSSAFGLMSIDDPNVLAGLSTDGVPFFSNAAMNMQPHSPNATPMPPKAQSQQQNRDRGMSLSALATPGLGRDSDLLWRTFMRTPMSGPHPGGSEAPASTIPQSPCPRRRPRVSSLPSSKTPTVERALPGMANGHAEASNGMRMTPHGTLDDLRSYEAAVNARNASLNLNLPKRRDTTHSQLNANFDFNVSRPSSSSSTSSLSQAFVPPHPPLMKGAAPPMNGVSISLPVPRVSSMGSSSTQSGSRESSVTSDCTGSSEGEVFRPSFKRLPSQTLGPANAKRAQLEKDAVSEKRSMIVNGDRAQLGVPNAGSRHIATLPDRARQSSDNRSSRGRQ